MFISDARDAAGAAEEPVDNDVAIARALELAGRLPTLANAAAMAALWAIALEKVDAAGSAGALGRFRASLDEFASIASALKDGDESRGLPRAAVEPFGDEIWSDPRIIQQINSFVVKGYYAHTLIAGPGASDPVQAAELAKFVDEELLPNLRLMIGHLSDVLADRTRKRQDGEAGARKLTAEMIDKLKDLTLRIQLISLNASVEAARAGPAGRGFGVIAQEINALSDNAQNAVDSISRGLAQTLREAQR